MKKKLDLVMVASIGATLLGVVGTLLSGWAGDKKTDKLIEEKVKEQIQKMGES